MIADVCSLVCRRIAVTDSKTCRRRSRIEERKSSMGKSAASDVGRRRDEGAALKSMVALSSGINAKIQEFAGTNTVR